MNIGEIDPLNRRLSTTPPDPLLQCMLWVKSLSSY